jgi:uncharacterized protein YpmB
MSQGGLQIMWMTVLICAAIFAFGINFWVQARQTETARKKAMEEVWTRQSRINALYGNHLFKEKNVEEK